MNKLLHILRYFDFSYEGPEGLPVEETDVAIKEGKCLVLYNDDFNTFDYVIRCLMEICDHNSLQAEQCAYIVHYHGKCEVLHAEDDKLEICCRLLQMKGLSATIE